MKSTQVIDCRVDCTRASVGGRGTVLTGVKTVALIRKRPKRPLQKAASFQWNCPFCVFSSFAVSNGRAEADKYDAGRFERDTSSP